MNNLRATSPGATGEPHRQANLSPCLMFLYHIRTATAKSTLMGHILAVSQRCAHLRCWKNVKIWYRTINGAIWWAIFGTKTLKCDGCVQKKIFFRLTFLGNDSTFNHLKLLPPPTYKQPNFFDHILLPSPLGRVHYDFLKKSELRVNVNTLKNHTSFYL